MNKKQHTRVTVHQIPDDGYPGGHDYSVSAFTVWLDGEMIGTGMSKGEAHNLRRELEREIRELELEEES